MEKDVIAVVHDNVIEMVDLSGHPKTTKKIGLSKFEFDFKVDGMGEFRATSRRKSSDSFCLQLSCRMTASWRSTRTECRDDL